MEIKTKQEPTHPHDQNKPFINNNVVVNNNNNNVAVNNNNNNVAVNNNNNNNNNKTNNDLFTDKSKEYIEHFNSLFPIGYRFNPTDEELILEYLQKKVSDQPLPLNKIWSVDLYLYHPQDLIEELFEKHEGEAAEDAWYFFTPRNRKYPNGTRPNRAAKGGYWKATGADKHIEHGVENKVVGYRKALVFYEGGAQNGVKTNWIMHEYRVNEPPRNKINAEDMKLDDYVLCKLHKKVDRSVRIARDEGEPQLGIVDDPKLLIPDDEYLNQYMNFDQYNDGDSGDNLFNPPMDPSHYALESMTDPRFMSYQITMQNGYDLWDGNDSRNVKY